MLFKALITLWKLEVDFLIFPQVCFFYFETYTLLSLSKLILLSPRNTAIYAVLYTYLYSPFFFFNRERNIFKFGFDFYKFVRRV